MIYNSVDGEHFPGKPGQGMTSEGLNSQRQPLMSAYLQLFCKARVAERRFTFSTLEIVD